LQHAAIELSQEDRVIGASLMDRERSGGAATRMKKSMLGFLSLSYAGAAIIIWTVLKTITRALHKSSIGAGENTSRTTVRDETVTSCLVFESSIGSGSCLQPM
jgi:hypothetical protein